MKVLVVYDGTLQSKDALRYGVRKVREEGGEVAVLHVFNSGMFIDYDALPWAEEIARNESERIVEEARKILRDEGQDVMSRVITEEGSTEEEMIRYARARDVDILVCPPRYRSVAKRYRKALQGDGEKSTEVSIAEVTPGLRTAVLSRR